MSECAHTKVKDGTCSECKTTVYLTKSKFDEIVKPMSVGEIESDILGDADFDGFQTWLQEREDSEPKFDLEEDREGSLGIAYLYYAFKQSELGVMSPAEYKKLLADFSGNGKKKKTSKRASKSSSLVKEKPASKQATTTVKEKVVKKKKSTSKSAEGKVVEKKSVVSRPVKADRNGAKAAVRYAETGNPYVKDSLRAFVFASLKASKNGLTKEQLISKVLSKFPDVKAESVLWYIVHIKKLKDVGVQISFHKSDDGRMSVQDI